MKYHGGHECIVALTIVALLLITVVGTGLMFTGSGRSVPGPMIFDRHRFYEDQGRYQDGSKDPSVIPDVDAHEMLFKVLLASSSDKYEEQRKASFLRLAGFSADERSAIVHAAYEYRRLISALDSATERIKMQHWPNPSPGVLRELAQLQRQKEELIALEVIAPLKAQLTNPERFDDFVQNEIKRKSKGFAPVLPRKISKLFERLRQAVSAMAQEPGCDTYVTVYTSTWVDYSDGMVYCNNSYSAPYNNCGHQYTLSFTMDNQTNPYLGLWGADREGVIQTFVNVDGYCPVVLQSFLAGSNSSSVNVEPYAEITGISVSSSHITINSQQSTATASYTYTTGASGKTFSYNPGYGSPSGITGDSDVTVSPNSETSTSCCGSVTWTYSCNTSANTGTFYAYGVFTSGSLRVLGSPKGVTGSQQIQVN